MKVLFLVLIFFVGSPAFSAWTHKPELGLGYTDNANYEENNKHSDLYWWARASSNYSTTNSFWSLWLSYKDYSSESQNDAFNWRLGSTIPASIFNLKTWSMDLGVGGQHYTTETPGTTEESFDYIFLEGALIKAVSISSKIELSLEPGYQFKRFANFNGRTDHRFYVNGQFDISLNSKHSLLPFGELGFILSNQSLYSRNYIEIGTDWNWKIDQNLFLVVSYMTRASGYPNRTVATETAVSNNRKSFKSVTQNENESHIYTHLSGSLVKLIKTYQLKGSLYVTSQESKSGFEDYSELGIKGSFTIPL